MEFLHPSFLWALLALAIPVIIHLFYFKRFKKVYFTNVKHLEELKEETNSRSRIKHFLILLSRLLALAALIFAFAQPYIPKGENVKKGNNAVSVFIDNSFSMNSESEGIPLIDIAKEKARQIVQAYGSSDRIQLLTHNFEGRHQRLLSTEDALSLIDDIQPTASVKTMSKILNRQKQALFGKEENEISYIISDFQQSMMDFPAQADTTKEVNLLPLQSVQEDNVSIDSVWLDAPLPMLNQNNKLIVRLRNNGSKKVEGVQLSVFQNGQNKPEGLFDIPARKSIIDTINLSLLKAGSQRIEVKISDYPVQFDDMYHVVLDVPEQINVLSIYQDRPNKYISALYKGWSQYQLTNQNQAKVNYSELQQYRLIILDELQTISTGLATELKDYVANGGNVLVFPSIDTDLNTYNSFLSTLGARLGNRSTEDREVIKINTAEFVFDEVYQKLGTNISLPKTSKNFDLGRGGEYLLQYRDGANFLSKYRYKKGRVYLCASPIDTDVNNLAQNAEVFVPMLYKMAIANDAGRKISYVIGKDNIIETDHKAGQNELVYEIAGETTFIPGTTNLGARVLLDVNNQVQIAGFYTLKQGETTITDLGFNYDRRESDLTITNINDLKSKAKALRYNIFENAKEADLSISIRQKDKGIVLWKWCIIFALLFLLVETLLLRLLPN